MTYEGEPGEGEADQQRQYEACAKRNARGEEPKSATDDRQVDTEPQEPRASRPEDVRR